MREAEWKRFFEGYCGEGSADTRDKHYMPLPVWTGGYAYFNGTQPCDTEEDAFIDKEHEITLSLTEIDGVMTVVTDLMDYLPQVECIDRDTLGLAFDPKQRLEEPNGDTIVFDIDLNVKKRTGTPVAGPFRKE